MSRPRLVLFDCDSTLSAIEGIDELARVRGPEIAAEVEAMTNAAMNGSITVESVFGSRLQVIRPEASHLAAIGQRYLETIEPTAAATMAQVRALGWQPLILSGGFRGAIRPLADHLGVERVEAVDLFFDRVTGAYRGFDERYPTTRSGGKPEIVRQLRQELNPEYVVMVGDGVSDLETKGVADLFVGYAGYVQRARVVAEADHVIRSLAELPAILQRLGGSAR